MDSRNRAEPPHGIVGRSTNLRKLSAGLPRRRAKTWRDSWPRKWLIRTDPGSTMKVESGLLA